LSLRDNRYWHWCPIVPTYAAVRDASGLRAAVVERSAEKPVDEHEKTAKAAHQVDALLGLYIHLTIFALVIALLLAVNWFVTPEAWWVQWVVIGWGIGVVGHALLIYGNMSNRSHFISRWRLRKIREFRERM